jgi:hypothetical protein
MSGEQFRTLKGLLGRRVSLALADGTRIDDCQLISFAGCEGREFWVFSNGTDLFVSRDRVTDVWEAPTPTTARVA